MADSPMRKASASPIRRPAQRSRPHNLFRIASVSKPVTSVTVFSLVEQGRIKLTDMVFGRTGILGNDYGTPRTSASWRSPSSIC